jgi:hypothetical protein
MKRESIKVDISFGDLSSRGHSFVLKKEAAKKLSILVPYGYEDMNKKSFKAFHNSVSNILTRSYLFGRYDWANLKSVKTDIDEEIVQDQLNQHTDDEIYNFPRFDWDSAAKEAFLLGFCDRDI